MCDTYEPEVGQSGGLCYHHVNDTDYIHRVVVQLLRGRVPENFLFTSSLFLRPSEPWKEGLQQLARLAKQQKQLISMY